MQIKIQGENPPQSDQTGESFSLFYEIIVFACMHAKSKFEGHSCATASGCSRRDNAKMCFPFKTYGKPYRNQAEPTRNQPGTTPLFGPPAWCFIQGILMRKRFDMCDKEAKANKPEPSGTKRNQPRNQPQNDQTLHTLRILQCADVRPVTYL